MKKAKRFIIPLILLFLFGFTDYSEAPTAQLPIIAPAEDYAVSIEQGNTGSKSKLYTVYNYGTQSISFQASSNQPWASIIVPQSGTTIPAGGNLQVTIYIVSGVANNLIPDDYEAKVTFTQNPLPPPPILSTEIKVKLTVTAPSVPAIPNNNLRVLPTDQWQLSYDIGKTKTISRSYKITNTSLQTVLYYQVTSNRNWVVVKPASGNLAGRKSVSLSLSIAKSVADQLQGGEDVATITVRNTSPGTSQPDITLQVRLRITLPPPPILAVSTTADPDGDGDIEFTFMQRWLPSPTTFTMFNTGTIPLNFLVTDNADWIDMTTTGGTINPDDEDGVKTNMYFGPSSSPVVRTLLRGEYSATITFANTTPNVAPQASITVPVMLHVLGPTLSVSAVTLPEEFSTFGNSAGSVNPPTSKTYNVSNTGDPNTVLQWSVTADQPWDQPWIVIEGSPSGSLAQGAPAQPVTVSLNSQAISDLQLEEDTLLSGNVSFNNITNPQNIIFTTRPVSVQVTFVQAGPLEVTLPLRSKLYGNMGGVTCPPNILFKLKNKGDLPMEWAASSGNSDWVHFSDDSGTIQVNPNNLKNVYVSLDNNNTPPPGNYKATINFTNTSPNSQEEVISHEVELVLSNGNVYAWGQNTSQDLLGVGTTGEITSPQLVLTETGAGLNGIVKVVAGRKHILALKSNGTVWAWGDDSNEALGNGNGVSHTGTPTQVSGLSNVIDIAAGEDHNLVLLQDGTVITWGINGSGQLGVLASVPRAQPQTIEIADDENLEDIVAIAAGRDHSVFLKKDGTAYYCGNSYGVGTSGSTSVPTLISLTGAPPNAKVIGIAAGKNQTLLLREDGHVFYVGENYAPDPNTGYDTGGDFRTEIVPGLSNVIEIAAGEKHCMAIVSDGSVLSVLRWGKNDKNQLGNGTTTDCFPTESPPVGPLPPPPTSIANSAAFVSNAKAISAGGEHSFALTSDGLKAWGQNNDGELGVGTSNNQKGLPTPVSVPIPGEPWIPVSISTGPYISVALE